MPERQQVRALRRLLLKGEDGSVADQKGYAPKDSETTVDQAPEYGYAADLTRNQSERNDAGAGDQAKRDDPSVANRIEKWSDERNRDHEVRKGKPVSTVGKKRVTGVRGIERFTNSLNPRKQVDRFGDWPHRTGIQRGIEPAEFSLKRKCGDAAQNQPDDENGEPYANAAKMIWGAKWMSHFTLQSKSEPDACQAPAGMCPPCRLLKIS